MGNKIEKIEKKELEQLSQKIDKLFEKKKIDPKTQLNQQQLLSIFKEREIFVQNLLIFSKKKFQKLTKKEFFLISQLFLIDSSDIEMEEYENHQFSFLQILLIISIQSDEIQKISQKQKDQFLLTLSNFIIGKNYQFWYKQLKTQFKDIDNFYSIQKSLKRTFPLLILQIKVLFRNFILQTLENEINLQKSIIIDKDQYKLLQLCNKQLFQKQQPELVYSSVQQGSSFHRLTHALKGYSAPLLILIKNKYSTIEKENNEDVFGAYTDCLWEDELGYFGSPTTFLFKISPNFDTFFSYDGKGGKNYVYMNSKKINNSKYKAGIGFGGQNYEDYRIWLDYDILRDSKSSDYGDTYRDGQLTGCPDNTLKILAIEIWGFHTQETLEKQSEFREQEESKIKNDRKIDKQLLLGEGKELLFQKQYEFKNNLNIDLEHQKRELKDQQQINQI